MVILPMVPSPGSIPESKDLPPIEVKFKTELGHNEEMFQPYLRDEKLVRPWAIPGTAGLEHRVGGFEKQNVTGNVSYDPENHQKDGKDPAGKSR